MASKMLTVHKPSRNSANGQLKMIEMIKNKTTSVLDIMDYYFRYTTYKNKLQAAAIEMILSSLSDVFVSMPDDYGRSMCYKLPALVKTPKITIVFCPLISRIQRHVAILSRLKIFTQALTSKTDPNKRGYIINEVSQRTWSSTIFYATPDEANAEDFQVFVKNLIHTNRVAYIVVDEVHSENQWLYGEKKNYKILGTIRKLYPKIPWIIVTSEASAEVVNMMKETLNLQTNLSGNVCRFAASCYRSNIYYDVIHDNINGKSYMHLKQFIKKCIEEGDGSKPLKSCGIIFCKTKKAAHTISTVIQISNITIVPYHSGLNKRQQSSIRNSFMKGSVKVIVIGGNYEKPIYTENVRFIVHWGIPASITQYYKETGIAGKDGYPARCRIYVTENSLLYFNETTEERMKTMLNEAEIGDNLKNALTNYLIYIQSRLMKDYCFSDKCRHSFLTYYFGEMKPRCNDKCDICMEECNLFYKGRALIKKSIDELGIEIFIKKVIAKYESHSPTQISTSETLNLLKICDELINVSNSEGSTDVLKIFNEWQSKLMLAKYRAEDDTCLALSYVQDGVSF